MAGSSFTGPLSIRLADGSKVTFVNASGNLVAGTAIILDDGDSFDDTNGNELLEFGVTASAVNHMKITNAATGNNASLIAEGGDASVGLDIAGKAGLAATNAGGTLVLAGGAGNTSGTGGATSLSGGAGGATGVGGSATLQGGAAGGGNSAGGAILMIAGAGAGTSAGGAVTEVSGGGANGAAAVNGGASGAVNISTGSPGTSATGTGGAGGVFNLLGSAGGATTGVAGVGGAGSAVAITGGAGGADGEASAGTGGAGGAITLTPGAGGAGNTAGADANVVIGGARGVVSSVANGFVPMVVSAAQDAITDTAAASVANYYTTLTTTAAAVPTLADGTIVGQMKKIQMIVRAVGDAVLTPANLNDGTTITFADVGDTAELLWEGAGWQVLALYNIVDGATAPVLA